MASRPQATTLEASSGISRSAPEQTTKTLLEIEAEQTKVTSGTPMIGKSCEDNTDHEIHDLMERETVIDFGTIIPSTGNILELPFEYDVEQYRAILSGSVTPQGLIGFYSFPDAIFNKNPVAAEKANYFTYMKTDVEVTLKVTNAPTTQGGFVLIYTPMAAEVDPILVLSNVTQQGMSSYPNSKLILNQDNSIKLLVPYISPVDAFNLQSPGFSFGNVAILCNSAFYGETEIQWTLMARFVNPKLTVPNASPIVSKSVFSSSTRRLLTNASNEQLAEVKKMVEEKMVRGMVSQGETDKPGMVEKVASTVGDVAGVLGNIPVVGDFAKPVSWVARGVSKVASWFGFSKPVTTQGPMIVTRQPGFAMVNGEGRDTSQTIGMIPDGGIVPAGVLFEDKDEMNIDYIKERSNVIEAFTWSSEAQAGELLGVMRCYPQIYKETGEVQLGTFDFVSGMFALWRGTINRRLIFYKTQYHMGRLAVVYFPTGEPPATLGELVSTNYVTLIDLNEMVGAVNTSSQIDIPIPYNNNRPYTRVFKKLSETVPGFRPKLGIYVLNPLRAPDIVSTEIRILAEISGGPSYELAVPTESYSLPRWTPPSTIVNPFKPDGCQREEQNRGVVRGMVSQSFNEDEAKASYPIVPETQDPGMATALQTIGEKVSSLRLLAKRFSPVGIYRNDKIATRPNLLLDYQLAICDQIALIYRFYYGGRRYKIPLSPDELATAQITTTTSRFALNQQIDSYSNANLEVSGQVNNLAEIEVPAYQAYRLNLVGGALPDPLLAEPLTSMEFSVSQTKANFFTVDGVTEAVGFRAVDINLAAGETYIIDPFQLTMASIAFDPVSFGNFYRKEFGTVQMGFSYEGDDVRYSTIQEFGRVHKIRSKTYIKIEVAADAPNSQSLRYFIQTATHGSRHLYTALSDTAGYTFLVGPPVVRYQIPNDYNSESSLG